MNDAPPHDPAEDPEWDDLRDLWRHDTSTPTSTPLLPAQEQLMHQPTRKLIFKFAAEWVAAAAVMAFYAVMLSFTPQPALIALAAGSAMFLILHLAVLTRTFRHTLRPTAHTTEAYLALTRRRLGAEHRWSGFVQLGALGFGLFVLAWAALFVATHDAPLRLLPGIAAPLCGVFAILGGVAYFARRTQRERLTQLKALEEA